MRTNPFDTYRQNRVLTADPVALVRLLLEEALRAVRAAAIHLEENQPEERAGAVTRAFGILTELMLNLNREQSPELSARLASLYEYCQHRLLEAHIGQSPERLEEVSRILQSVLEAWAEVQARQTPAAEGTRADWI